MMHIDTDQLAAIGQYAQSRIDRQQFAGIAWSFRHGDDVVDEGVCGYADHALQQPLESDAIYRLYSMTKPVVSVRILQLLESGKLKLEDKVSRWIPAFADQQVLTAEGELVPVARAITVEDLLTHRAGLSYDFLPDCEVASRYRDVGLVANGHRPLSELVGILASLPLASQPGARWHYSYATDVLAHLIELVCDQPLDENLQQALFKPLAMQETGFCVQEHKRHRLADMFGQRQLSDTPITADSDAGTDNQLQCFNVDESYPISGVDSFLRGGMGLFSTISDYQKFMNVLMHGLAPDGRSLLSTAMLDLLWQNRLTANQMPINIAGRDYPGYGWGLTGRVMTQADAALPFSVVGEGGWSGAASTHFWVDRANNVSGIVMAQYLGSNITLGFDVQNLCNAALDNSLS